MPPVFDFLRFDDIPRLARRNYAIELRHIVLWGLFANLVDGSFSSIVVAKTFQSPWLVPVVWATPMLAHLLSLVWGVLVRGRPKVRTFVLLALGALVSAGSIAFTPSDWQPWGGWLFAAQIAAARIFMSGLVTVRTSIWKANYPQSHRARIAGRIQTINALLMLVMGGTVSLLFDQHAEYYRWVYPAIAALGVLALVPLRRLRVRGEACELRAHAERAGGAEAVGHGAQLRRGLAEAAGILRHDRDFARYCSAQYLLGSANLMVDPVLTIFLTQSAKLGYFTTYLLMDQIPMILAVLSIRYWAHLFDRVGVLRFRVFNGAWWLVSIVLAATSLAVGLTAWPAALTAALGILAVGRVVNGLGRGGGAIAWNLGHLHFAGEHDAELYLGIHVALTGVRGIIMPFVGSAVYHVVGAPAMLIAVALSIGSLLAFRRLAADEARAGDLTASSALRPHDPGGLS
jgi:MFS family permease